MTPETTWNAWLLVGFTGQALFSCRFIVQWIASERLKTSVIPERFWWLSLGGGVEHMLGPGEFGEGHAREAEVGSEPSFLMLLRRCVHECSPCFECVRIALR